jgi:hypothetical protein
VNAADQHPPANRRCQIYLKPPGDTQLARCINLGTHWVRWGGCSCGQETEYCETSFESWECDGPCLPELAEAA